MIGNAAPVQDRGSGRILVPFCRNNHDVLLKYSDDDGVSWSTATPVPSATMPQWRWIGLGPPGSVYIFAFLL